ncbi:MAG: class I SAM-dependent rRNA methyltransferase [Bradymonadaceae bacterium]
MPTLKFRVPLEPDSPTVGELLRRAWPQGTDEQIEDVVERLNVRIRDRRVRKLSDTPVEGDLVEAEVGEGEEVFGLPEGDALAWGEGWVVATKPTGMGGRPNRDDPMDSVLFLADMLGIDRDEFEPVWTLPELASGPWLLGLSAADAKKFRKANQDGEIMMTWVAIVPRMAVPRGTWTTPDGLPLDYSMTRAQGGVCEVQLIPRFEGSELGGSAEIVDAILDTVAAAGYPVLADPMRGGYMVDGGLRLRLAALVHEGGDLAHSWPPPEDWWPDVAVVAVEEKEPTDEAKGDEKEAGEREILSLQVSSQTLEIMAQKGHPWVLHDSKTGSVDHLKPGSIVRLRDPAGKPGPYALVEGSGSLVARFWGKGKDDVEAFAEEVEMRVDEAVAQRAPLLRELQKTNVFRLIHGEADSLPGLLVDRLGPVVRATLRGRTSHGFKHIVYENLLSHEPNMMLLEVEHLQDVREGDALPNARIVHAGGRYLREGERLTVLEDGLRYLVEPWEGIDVGFFPDQRENRRKLVDTAEPASRWLNLFCHTGAFTVALANKGASVVSVDLSRRYLNWLEENLKINGLDEALNTSVEADCRDYLKSCEETFDGIIVDPPTASTGASGFWSVRREYETLLGECFRVLAPGGVMLVCRNDRKQTPSLKALVERAAEAAGRVLREVEEAPPAMDYPRLKGFPEGDAFEGLIVKA